MDYLTVNPSTLKINVQKCRKIEKLLLNKCTTKRKMREPTLRVLSHSCLSYSLKWIQSLSLYSFGDMPTTFLKILEK